MKKNISIVSLSVVLLSCNLNNAPEENNSLKLDSLKIARDTTPVVKEFKGLYRPHYSTFINCEDGKTYVLKNNDLLDSLYKEVLPNAYTDEAVYVKMNASIDPNQSDIINFDPGSQTSMEQKNHKNTCIPYEYWCTGIEPFWIIQISKAEDLIDFYEPMEQRTTHFMYAVPVIKDETTIYSSSDGENKIIVTIKKEKCNGAIDKQYDYSASVQLNGNKYNGCAIKFAENN